MDRIRQQISHGGKQLTTVSIDLYGCVFTPHEFDFSAHGQGADFIRRTGDEFVHIDDFSSGHRIITLQTRKVDDILNE